MTSATPPSDCREVVIRAVDCWHHYGDVPTVRGVSLRVHQGEIYGLVGPDGAGKTTLMRLLVGLLDPSKGQAFLLGKPAVSESADVRALVGYMPQQASLYGDLTVDENLSFFGAMVGLGRKEFAERKAILLHLTRLSRFTDRRADALSGGMYKKLALSCALLHKPRILVLDEPTNGVDPVSRREFWDLISTFVSEGMGVILSTPSMDEAARCTRVGLMHNGAFLEQGVPKDMLGAFQGRAFRVVCENRNELAKELDYHPEVIALSPSGGAMRVVVTQAGVDTVMGVAARLGATFDPVHPVFEDVFLARLRNNGTATHMECDPT